MNHNAIKSQALMDIMKAMRQRDASRIRPKPPAMPEAPAPAPTDLPHMAEGGVVTDDRLHVGQDSDMSEDDAKILESLYDSEEGIEGQPRHAANEAEEPDEDDEAGAQ